MDSKDTAGQSPELRLRAEEIARQAGELAPEDRVPGMSEEIRRTLHELHVHQIELEMQNEELRRIQLELEGARARYFDLYDLAPVGYCTLGANGLIQEANLTAATLLGIPKGALPKQPFSRFLLAEDQDIYYLQRRQVLDTGEPRTFELRMVNRAGPVFWVRLAMTITADKAGQTICRIVMSDVTERKRAEETLRASDERYRSIVAACPDSITIADIDGRIVMVSPVTLTMFHRQREEELLGLSILNFIVPEDRERAAAKFADMVKGATPAMGEYRALRPDGSTFSIEVNAAFVRDAEGRPTNVVLVARDVTERKRAEEEKVQLEARFQQAQKMESIGRLAGGVAHDFNNLLTVINGYSTMLLTEFDLAEPVREELEEIYKAGERAARLTAQLLAYSRKQILLPRHVDLNHVVREMMPMLRRLLGEDIAIGAEFHADPAPVFVDPHQLEQVVMNLAVNARDAMPGGGDLKFETSCESRSRPDNAQIAASVIVLAVSDSGQGMNEATRLKIFDPFFTTKGVGRGTGLGLSMVEGFVSQSGGNIEVFSEPGRGSIFKIYLPMVETVAVEPEEPGEVRVLVGNETVLVVEDHDAVRKLTADALSAFGYHVKPAEHAAAAIEICEHERVDLILTDVVMPQMSGPDLAGRLRSRWPGMKVLFMSGFAANDNDLRAVMGTDGVFIQKPFSPAELAGKVREVLDGELKRQA